MSRQNFEPSMQAVSAAVPAPAKRSFYAKKRFILPAGGVLLLGIVLGSCSGASSKSDGGVGGAAATAAALVAERGTETQAAELTTPTPVAPPTAAAPAVGTPFSVNMRNGNVARITIVSAVRTDAVSTTAFAPPAKNGTYLLLDVLWSAKDASRRKADLSMFADNRLGTGDILPGDKSRASSHST